MRPTAEPVNPMWDGYKIDIVPHLMDPEGKAVTVFKKVARAIAAKYETDVTAKISFAGAYDYKFEFFLRDQLVENWVIYNHNFIKIALEDNTLLQDTIARKHFAPIDGLIAVLDKTK